MNFKRNLLSEAVRFGIAAGAVGLISLAAAPAFAQETEDEAAELERIEVTGSRIKRADAATEPIVRLWPSPCAAATYRGGSPRTVGDRCAECVRR